MRTPFKFINEAYMNNRFFMVFKLKIYILTIKEMSSRLTDAVNSP